MNITYLNSKKIIPVVCYQDLIPGKISSAWLSFLRRLLFSNNSFLIPQRTLQCIKLRKKCLDCFESEKKSRRRWWWEDKSEKPVLSDFSFLGNFVRNALWIIQTSWWWIWRIKHLNFLENIILIQMQLFFLFGVCGMHRVIQHLASSFPYPQYELMFAMVNV